MKKEQKDKLTVVGLMISTSFGELYIFRDYSVKYEKNEFQKAPKDSRTQPKWAPRKMHLEGTRGPHAKVEPSLGPAQADRPCEEADRAPWPRSGPASGRFLQRLLGLI
jgi:hypothetical protein